MTTEEIMDRVRKRPEEERRGDGSGRKEFVFKVAGGDLAFTEVVIDDPVPTARQLSERAGFEPAVEHLIFKVANDPRLRELELDQTTDLREHGAEQFLIFRSDRSWRAVLDDKRFEWGDQGISGRALKWIADVDPDKYGVWLELRDEPDRLIGNDDTVSLADDGVERFRTGALFFICIEDETYPWPRGTIKTEEIAQLGGWDASDGVVEVDEEQNERTLEPGEVIKLRPGLSFGKKFCFKRG